VIRPAIIGLAISLAVSACASGGVGQPEVPVYFSPEDVPCAYRVMATVVEDVPVERSMRLAIRRVMRDVAAEAGADAVLVPERYGEQGTAVRVPVEQAPLSGRRAGNVQVEAALLEFTEEGCGAMPR